jgi:hypothetical protein
MNAPLRSEALLLTLDTNLTCPSCALEFTLQEGFAKRTFEQLQDASAASMTAMREAERASVEKRAREMAAEHARAARGETDALKKLLKEQSDKHSKDVIEVRSLAEKGVAPRIEELQRALEDSAEQVQAFRAREESLSAREQNLESRVSTAAESKANELVAAERKSFDDQLAEKNKLLAALRDDELKLRREREQLKDAQAAMQLTVQKKADERVNERELTVRAQEQERAALKEAELQKTIADMRSQLVEAQRKADQGSQQMQGEVLELAIEEALRRAFPLDIIEEVKKGQRGGDVKHHVVTRAGHTAGTILWETKRAKDWSPQWVPKLKEDMRASGAVVGILVTMPGVFPQTWRQGDHFAPHDDVWVTQAGPACGVAELLRAGLIDLHRQRAVSAGKGEKMEALYDYLTSPQFAQKLKAVFETFKKMREELESEKNVTTQRWARREKQLQAGMTQLVSIGGEIQGLAQQELPMLEMEPDVDTNDVLRFARDA